MPTSPQAVTERYVSNLIHNGLNRKFRIQTVTCNPTYIKDFFVGFHFVVWIIEQSPVEAKCGIGATVADAMREALRSHGVTFR